MKSGWDLLKAGLREKALQRLKKEYQEDPDLPTLISLGIGYLWAKDYRNAILSFETCVEQFPNMPGAHQWAGVAHWCSDQPSKAVDVWQSGLDCGYADAAGGIEIPCLLYFASVLAPGVSNMPTAVTLIKDRLKSPWAANWPAPIGRFLIGEMSEQELRNKAQFRQELVTAQQMVAVEFYVGIAAKRAGDESSYYAHLEACHKIPKMEDIYEHYLALFELSRKSKMKGPKPRSR